MVLIELSLALSSSLLDLTASACALFTMRVASVMAERPCSFALSIAFFAVAASVVGALIPAIVAAKTRPVNILRYE